MIPSLSDGMISIGYGKMLFSEACVFVCYKIMRLKSVVMSDALTIDGNPLMATLNRRTTDHYTEIYGDWYTWPLMVQ